MWDERVNTAIDEVARQMTAAASPAGGADFRRRVLARIAANDKPRASWRAAFALSPIALAAAIVIAVFVVGRPRPVRPGVSQPAGNTVRLPPSPLRGFGGTGKPDTTEAAGPKGPALQVVGGFQPRERSLERAAPQTTDVLEPAPQLDPIEVDSIAPAPLVVGTLAPDPIRIERIETITPVTVAPLEIITDMQRRQE